MNLLDIYQDFMRKQERIRFLVEAFKYAQTIDEVYERTYQNSEFLDANPDLKYLARKAVKRILSNQFNEPKFCN